MAFITEWNWEVIDRRRDFSVVNFIETFRENWTLTRSRITNNDYVSQLGESGVSLFGYNGGTLEIVEAPSGYQTAAFFELAGDTGGYPYTEGVTFIRQSYQRNGKDVYLYTEPSPRDTEYYWVLFYDDYTVPGGNNYAGNNYFWWGAQVPADQALNGTFPSMSGIYASSSDDLIQMALLSNSSSTDTPFDSTGNWRDPTKSAFTTGFSLVEGEASLSFRCISDTQTYEKGFVDWYKQTQTWALKTPWGI